MCIYNLSLLVPDFPGDNSWILQSYNTLGCGHGNGRGCIKSKSLGENGSLDYIGTLLRRNNVHASNYAYDEVYLKHF